MFYEGKTLKEAKKDVDSFWSYLYQKEEKFDWRKTASGEIVTADNIDDFIPKITPDKAEEMLQQIAAIDKAKGSWNEYFKELQNNNQGCIVDLIKNTDDLSKLTGDDLVKANQNARQAAIAHNAALKQQTLGAKAASVAMKGLALVGNVALSMLASVVVTKVVGWVDDLIHASEKAKEAANELSSDLQSQKETIEGNISTVKGLEDEFKRLSKGVDDYGANISLSTDEYERYQQIVKEIVGISPSLIAGYDKEGNAIANKNSLIEQSIELLKEENRQRIEGATSEEAVKTLAKGKIEEYKDAEALYYADGGVRDLEMDIAERAAEAIYYDRTSANDAVKMMNEIGGDILDTFNNTSGTLEERIEEAIARNAEQITQNYSKYRDILEKYLVFDDLSFIDNTMGTYSNKYSLYISKIESAAKALNPTLQTVPQSLTVYDELSDRQKAFIAEYVNTFRITADTTKKDVEEMRQNILEFTQAVGDATPETKKAIEDLFSLDKSKIPAGEWEKQVNDLINQIVNSLTFDSEEDKNAFIKQLKIRLGFEFTTDGETSVDTMIEGVKEKVQDEFDGKIDKLGFDELQIAYKIIAELPEGKLLTWDELKEKIDATTQSSDKMTVSLSDLSTASEALSSLSKAFKELNDNGYITTDTITKIKEATGLGEEEWKKYESTLLNAKVGSDEYNRSISELTYKILENKIGLDKLTEADEDYITAVLRENGVLNAEAVTADITAIALSKLTLQKSLLNKEEIDTSAEAEEILSLANAANASVASIERLAKVVKYLKKAEEAQGKGETNLAEWYRNEAKRYLDSPIEYDKISLDDVDYSGALSSSTKNEALDNYLKEAESRYKIHQNETKYIDDLNHALSNLAKTDEERLEITEKINEAYRDSADNTIKDLEHQIDLKKELYGEDYNPIEDLNNIQKVAHDEAERLRKMGYDDNSSEIQALQKTWWDAENSKLDFYSKQHEIIIRDIEHARDMALETNPYVDTTSYYKQLQEEYHKEAERLRALDPEKYKEEIQELQQAWWDAQNAIVDWRWENSQNWINQRNAYNDWALFGDSEIEAWERVVKWLKEEYPNDLDKIKEAEQSLFEARKKEFDKANDFGNTYLESRKTLLQSYYDVTNSIAEAQHEINKELEASKTMYEYLDEDTRKLLFNQEDYNALSEELLDIQYAAQKLQRQYERDLNNSTLETIESITSEYQMQYETLMKSYEIAKADLEIAKKKQKLNNVLNERNVRMFINGQWQWVANTEDVINAKSELADAEYAKRVEESGLAQQQSINNLTKQQNELTIVIKKFENGVIDLASAIAMAKKAIGSMPSSLSSMYSNVSSGSTSQAKSNKSNSNSSIKSYDGVWYDSNTDYMANIYNASSEAEVLVNNAARNAKIRGEGLSGDGIVIMDDATAIQEWKDKNQHADGTRYTPGGMTLMGEDGFEAYIDSNGHLIPINQPTIGNIASGGVVFNTDQMKNLRTLWDMSNLSVGGSQSLLYNTQPQQIDQRQDNRIIINGMTVDSGSSDGQALISALRRYVGNH